jgi:hypothetical protein
MDTSTYSKFDLFAAFYKLNRDRFEFHERKRYDELVSRVGGPTNFDWTAEDRGDYQHITVSYTKRGKHIHEFPLFNVDRFFYQGKDVIVKMAEISERLEELDKDLPDAMFSLLQMREDPQGLRLTIHVTPTGALTFLKATEFGGLVTIKAELKSEE